MGKLVAYLFGIGKAKCNLNMVLAFSKKKVRDSRGILKEFNCKFIYLSLYENSHLEGIFKFLV